MAAGFGRLHRELVLAGSHLWLLSLLTCSQKLHPSMKDVLKAC